jgi:AmiR/NasT family two-component response regulator
MCQPPRLGPYQRGKQSELGDEAPDAADEDEKRDVVAQATGMLAAEFGLNTEAALDKLTAEAADSGRPVIDVAHDIVEQSGL